MKRKLLSLFLVSALVVSTLAGCTAQAPAPAPEAPAPAPQAAEAVPVNTTDWAKAPNGKILVSPAWVDAVINGQAADTYTNDQYVILEASWGPVSEDYKAGHIPGAYHFDTDTIETEANFWNIGPVDHVEKGLLNTGITKDTTVIVYSNTPDASSAARVVLAMLWAGVEDVRLLDGGLTAWKAAGLKTETTENKPVAVKEFGTEIPQHPEYLLAAPQDVLEAQKNPEFRLISIRSWKEFVGETSGYGYIKGAGEPLGAVWGHDVNGGGENDGYLNADGTFKSFKEVESMWAEQGVTKETRNSFYCGTGWRAAVPWLMAFMQGWENTTLYDGGWYMWEMDKSLPVQKGEPKK